MHFASMESPVFEVIQISKSRWIVTRDGNRISKHASLADAQRAAKNYAAKLEQH